VIIDEPNEITAAPPLILYNVIYLSASGGTGTLHYSLDGGTPQLTGQFNNVSGGTHTITVTDNNSCELTVNGIIITGIDNVNDVKYIIFPNPSEGLFNLQLSTSYDNTFNVQIYNTTGALVYENKTLGTQQNGSTIIPIDITNKGTGIFIIKLNGIPLNERLVIR
jgi:hypothetical protein